MLSNWTKATTTTTGTGTLTLAEVTGFPMPSDSLSNGQYVQYSIKTSDGKFESGIGKIGASETIERTNIFSTFDGTTYNETSATALTLASGTHEVFITTVAEMQFEPLKNPLVETSVANPIVYSTHIMVAEANISASIAKQRNQAYPFRLETAGIITGFAINVSTAVASSTCRAGIYAALPTDGSPGELIIQASADFDTSSTGIKTQSVSANKRINPGWYWAALCVTSDTSVPTLTGGLTTRAAFGADSKVSIRSMYESATATSLADPFPRTNLLDQPDTGGIPLIGLIMA
jgi:hypothetical protein